MINEAPKPETDAEKLTLLLAAASQAFDFLEHYCTCRGAKGVVAKQLRVAIAACSVSHNN